MLFFYNHFSLYFFFAFAIVISIICLGKGLPIEEKERPCDVSTRYFRLTLSFKIANPCKPFFKAASREVNQAFNYVNSVTYKYTKNYLYTSTYNRYLDTYRANHLFKKPLEKRNIKKIAYKVSPEELKAFKKQNAYIEKIGKKKLKAENKSIQKHNRNLYNEIRQLTLNELG